MDKTTKICNNCGEVCDINESYCHNCSTSFKINTDPYGGEQVIDGIENAEVERFIDKRREYYMSRFEKARGKKVFLSLNFAALFFGTRWLFYRKMFKPAIIYLTICLSISLICTIVTSFTNQSKVDEYYRTKDALEQYESVTEELYTVNPQTNRKVSKPEYQQLYNDYKAAKENITNVYSYVWLLVPAELFSRLFFNMIYRNHIKKTAPIDMSKGGTSLAWALLSILIVDVASTAISLAVFFIPAVRELSDAYALAIR